jgi:hypothetical protein
MGRPRMVVGRVLTLQGLIEKSWDWPTDVGFPKARSARRRTARLSIPTVIRS